MASALLHCVLRRVQASGQMHAACIHPSGAVGRGSGPAWQKRQPGMGGLRGARNAKL
jgi:hypothetical protein